MNIPGHLLLIIIITKLLGLGAVGQETALHEHGGAAHMLQKVDLPRFFAGPVIVWIELRSKCGLQPVSYTHLTLPTT